MFGADRTPKRGMREAVIDAKLKASRCFEGGALPLAMEAGFHSFLTNSNYLKIETELKHTMIQLNHLVVDCNRRAWGYYDQNSKAPTDRKLVTQTLEDNHGLEPKARQAHQLREYAKQLAEGLETTREAAMRDAQARGAEDHERQLHAQFEASEAESKERRFQEWHTAQDSVV